IWIGIIVAIVLLAKGSLNRAKKGSGSAGESAVDVLKKRYARGEISKEEFEEKKSHIV
ncbi:MAG: SHOCT domain-containing protein, partial [Proteobacteria bacterium]|nr:SHOCT domain-containing protein [Pseudomonadota bacterium]